MWCFLFLTKFMDLVIDWTLLKGVSWDLQWWRLVTLAHWHHHQKWWRKSGSQLPPHTPPESPACLQDMWLPVCFWPSSPAPLIFPTHQCCCRAAGDKVFFAVMRTLYPPTCSVLIQLSKIRDKHVHWCVSIVGRYSPHIWRCVNTVMSRNYIGKKVGALSSRNKKSSLLLQLKHTQFSKLALYHVTKGN